LLVIWVRVRVAALFVWVGVPTFVTFVRNLRTTTHTNDLVMALNLGRSEATRRGAPVVVCASSDGATCSAANDWSTGWIVLAPGNRVVGSWPEREGGANILTANVAQIQFQPRGSVAAAGTLFQVRLPDCAADQGRDLSISVAGRVSVARVDCP
jgi:type IV fimbrial biogenesis protein FimT